jgi:octaprenyl-diphosphate synthase
VARYIISSGGKRLRPVLLLLTCRRAGLHQRAALQPGGGGRVHPHRHPAARRRGGRITLRRGRATANEVFGNPASVLVGDFLYSRAFQMMVETGNMRVMEVLADATNVIAEGEVLQLMNMHDLAGRSGLPARDPLQDRQAVRGQLPPGRRCWPAAPRAGSGLRRIRPVAGHRLPGDRRRARLRRRRGEMGKNLGDDLREGKATLPLILAMRLGTPEEARRDAPGDRVRQHAGVAASSTSSAAPARWKPPVLLAPRRRNAPSTALRALPANSTPTVC